MSEATAPALEDAWAIFGASSGLAREFARHAARHNKPLILAGRDVEDLENHFDYIHYNPVKHGFVKRPRDWAASTFQRWVDARHYDINWGAGYVPRELPGDAGE